jgi:hypothetical protein
MVLCEEGMTIAKTKSALSVHIVPNRQHQQKHKVIQGRFTNIIQTLGRRIIMWRHEKKPHTP